MINVAIVHSHAIYRYGIALLLVQEIEDLNVVVSLPNIRELLHQYRQEVIDVIIWSIPSHHTLTPGARLLKECFPLAKILVMVSSRNSVYAGLLKTLGADAVIPDDCKISDLSEEIMKIHQTYAPPPSSNHVQEPGITNRPKKLSPTENKIFQMLSQGLSHTAIASRAGISEEKVAQYRSIIKMKLGVKNLSDNLE
jgi:DNA-binding NarL/FixJ family response regulator